MRISDWSSDVCSSDLLLRCFQNKIQGAGCIPHSDVGLVARCYLSAARCDPVGTNRVIQHLKLRVFHSILKMMMEIHGVYRARDSWRSDLIRRRSDAGPTTSTEWLKPSNHHRNSSVSSTVALISQRPSSRRTSV